MRKVIGLLAIIVTATLLLFTGDTSPFMLVVYLLILYLGNSFLMSQKESNDLVPLFTTTELFYVFDFYLVFKNEPEAWLFCFLAVAFSLLSIILLVKEKKTNLPIVAINEEKKKYDKMRKISLVLLIGALVFNVILLSLINFYSITGIYELTLLAMTLLMTVTIIYQGYIAREPKNENDETKADMLVVSAVAGNINTFNVNNKKNDKYKRRIVSNRPYFILSMFYLLFLPQVLHESSNLIRILYVCFFVYLLIIMYYPLAKSEYYGFRKNDKKYRLGWLDYLKKSIIYNVIFILCGLTLSFSIFYFYSIREGRSYQTSIHAFDSSINFTSEDKENISSEIRNKYKDDIYLAFEDDYMEKTNDIGERYKSLLVYTYDDNDSNVYVYEYRKYTTESNEHKLGEVREYGYKSVAPFDKSEIDNKNLTFYK